MEFAKVRPHLLGLADLQASDTLALLRASNGFEGGADFSDALHLAHRSASAPPTVAEHAHANPKNTARPRFTPTKVVSSNRSKAWPTFSRGTVVALSTITCECFQAASVDFKRVTFGVSRFPSRS